MTNYCVKNKVVIVTGATKGMGKAAANELLKQGAKVTLVYLSDSDNAEKVKAEFADYAASMLFVQADITHPEERASIVEQTVAAFGQIDVLVNNAGTPAKKGFLKGTEDDFDQVIDVNLKAPIFLAQLVAKQMIQQGHGGSVINISSICGYRPMGGISYDAAKAGIIRATQTMANAMGQYGVRVNSISPGIHKTEMNRNNWESNNPGYLKMLNATVLERAGEANEIAGTVLYLASDQSSYTTGADIVVDGGYLSHCPNWWD